MNILKKPNLDFFKKKKPNLDLQITKVLYPTQIGN